MSKSKQQVVLTDPDTATVDDVVLDKLSEQPTELTDDQIERLKEAGAKLEVLSGSEDLFDALKGKDLEDRYKVSGLRLGNDASAEDKRQALREQAAGGETESNGGDV